MKNLLPFMRQCTLFLILLCACFSSKSQNWNLFTSNDTSYYYNYQPTVYPLKLSTYEPDLFHGKGTLQVIWIDSLLSNIGGDSTFTFQRTIKQPIYDQCIDTTGQTIFGNQFIKTSNNSFYVFNELGDTMIINPLAELNDSWIFYNQNGIEFQATINAVDTQKINGVIDSVKRILITEITNSSIYSSLNIIISKNHGIIESFPFDKFLIENNLDIYFYLDPSLYKLPLSYMNYAMEKYQPGNYWRRQYDSIYVMGFWLNHSGIIQDSILSSTITLPNQIDYTFVRTINGIRDTLTESQTFSTTPINFLKGIYPNFLKSTSLWDWNEALKKYEISFLQDTSFMLTYTTFSSDVIYDSCWHADYGLVNYETFKLSSNQYFHNIDENTFKIWTAYPGTYDQIDNRIIFYKIGPHTSYIDQIFGLKNIKLSGSIETTNFAQLNWVTTGEKNIASFELQRSNREDNFERITIINSQGDSDDEQYYTYNDDISNVKESNNIMYRILVLDIDGHTSYSNIINLNNLSTHIAHLFPNPFTTELNIKMNSSLHGEIKITMTDLSGRIILNEEISASSNTTKKMSVPSSIPSGVYFVTIEDEEYGVKEVVKMVK